MADHELEDVEGREGLSWCPRCGGAEGSLPTECPGQRMHHLEEQRVYAGHLDYRAGRWELTGRKGMVIRITGAFREGLRDGVDPWIDPWAERDAQARASA